MASPDTDTGFGYGTETNALKLVMNTPVSFQMSIM
jgi:hypothetical protein